MNRRGFTFIEILMVFAVIAILVTIAVLKYVDLRNHALVTNVQSELNAVRLAAYNYWADRSTFPPEAAPGVVPTGMAPYLSNTDFSGSQYTLDWENFQGGGGGGGAGGMQVGIVVTSTNTGLMTLLARRATGGLPYFVVGNTLAYIIVGPDGNM